MELCGELFLEAIVELLLELMTEVFKLPLEVFNLPFKGRDSSFELTLMRTSRRDYWNGLGLRGEVWLAAEQMYPASTRRASDQGFR